MKLLIVLSIVAYGYADKLDRAYLPPVSAASAGGSPGALTAPGLTSQSGFGQKLSLGSGRQPISGIQETGQFAIGQGLPSSSGSRPGSVSGQYRPSSYSGVSPQNGPGNGLTSGSNTNSPFNGASGPTSAPQGQTFGSISPPQANAFNVIGQQSFRPQSSNIFSQAFGQETPQGQGINVAQAYKPERAQAAADRNAEILKYVNENNGDTYIYSYETSNGISAEESGVATNGVKAQGGFSYTDDDGQAYSLIYTADENGFRPQGEHLPTPHPIPEEILKSIEDNARAAAAGIQEGAYRPEEYDNEGSPQQYNTGLSSFTQSQGAQSQGFNQGSFPSQGSVTTQAQRKQYSVNQGGLGSNLARDQTDQISQKRPSQGSNQFGSLGQDSQYQQGFGIGSQNPIKQFTGQGSSRPSQNSQIQGSSEYIYSQPQNIFGSATQFGSGTYSQIRPQISSQDQISSSTGFPEGQGTFSVELDNRPTSKTPFGTLNKPENQPTGSAGIFGQRQQNQLNTKKPLFEPSQISQIRPGTQESTASSGQGYQYNSNTNRPLLGVNNPSDIASQPSQGSQYKLGSNQQAISPSNGINQGPSLFFGDAGSNQVGRAPQFQQNGNVPSFTSNFGGSGIKDQGSSPFASGIQKAGSGQLAQANQPINGANARPGQSTSEFGLGNLVRDSSNSKSTVIQAPYQYNKPSQPFSPQQQRPGSSGVNIQRPEESTPVFQGVKGQRPGFGSPGAQGTTGQRPGFISPESQTSSTQRPGANFPGSQAFNGQRPGASFPRPQGIGEQRPDTISSSSQSVNGQRPGAIFQGSKSFEEQRPSASSPRPQGFNGKPDVISESVNGPRPGVSLPDQSSSSSLGVNGQRPSLNSPGSTGFNGQRPGQSTGYQSTINQIPESSLSGPAGRPNQGRPEQFGGPRQPPSFSSQEGYKY